MNLKRSLKLFALFILLTTTFNVSALTLTSTAFQNNGFIPSQYTCNGKNILPPLSWYDIPAATKSFAITLTDPDAPGGIWTHWVIYNIPANVNSIAEGESSFPAGSVVLNNSWKHTKYDGPCPPSGTHHYWFIIYALDDSLNLTNGNAFEKNIQDHLLAKASLVGRYSKR